MATSSFDFAPGPDDRSETQFDCRLTGEMERSIRFGLRRRELEGVLPSGSITIDAAMGVGGLPRGRMMEVFGPPSVGKTTLGLQAVAAVQREGDTAAFVDVEHAFDGAYAETMGVQLEPLLLARAEDGRQALEVVERLAACKAVDLIVVDSVAALLPPEERDAAVGEASPFGQCELLASGLRRLSRALQGSPACILFLNQVRAYAGFGYGETSAGGWALKLHAAIRADLRARKHEASGARLELRIVKNQLAKPRQMEFDFRGGVGVVREAELLERALETGVMQCGRTGFTFANAAVGKNREEALQRLAQHATMAAQIETEVRLALGLTQRKPVGREGKPAETRRNLVNG